MITIPLIFWVLLIYVALAELLAMSRSQHTVCVGQIYAEQLRATFQLILHEFADSSFEQQLWNLSSFTSYHTTFRTQKRKLGE
jgi:hypothetical protein